MALSLLQQHPSFTDLQSFFDPFPIQQRSATVAATTIADLNSFSGIDPMEYATNNNHQPHQRVNNVNNNNNNSHNSSNNNNGVVLNSSSGDEHHFSTVNNNQHLPNTNRAYISGYHHQHISNDYEQVINFVDSPPNSEGSWADEQSKGSPGPQIIEVQSLYTNCGTRKRRMDWDSLDIGQGGNTSSTQSADIANKIPHLSGGNSSDEQNNNNNNNSNNNTQQQDKEKHKKEKLSGRGSWTDDIDFDLNAEFNSNSYLNNETFLSFSSALTVLKQEPQTEQLKDNKNTAGCITKVENKNIEQAGSNNGTASKKANDLNGAPASPTTGYEQITRFEKTIVAGHDNLDTFATDKNTSRKSPAVAIQSAEIAAATSLSDDHKFQYILAAATSIATKNNEETLTYLNQGQSYEIKLKKTGDLSFYRDKILKSVIKICFHERRLQYMEREQMQQWQASRPGERIIEVDVPLSYGLCHVSQPLSPNFLNTVEVFWDPLKEVGVYIKVNCISTEFTPKKHGGEKGVPFRLQIETYIENSNTSSAVGVAAAGTTPTGALPTSSSQTLGASAGSLTPNANTNGNNPLALTGKQPVHAAACQIKVFKLKGADRKHKQDREKIQKRSQLEQDKFQPSYECTIMNDLPLDLITPSPGCFSPEYIKVWPNSPVHVPKYDEIVPYASTSPASNSSPIAINSVTSSNSPTLKLMDTNMVSPQQVVAADTDDCIMNIMPDATPTQVTQWLTYHRLTAYLSTFAHFSGSDIMRMSKEDLIQICGLADGIRMFNILRAKVIAPRLTIYVSMDGSSYNAIYLISNTSKELQQKLYKLPGFYDLIANHNTSGPLENGGALYNGWGGMHTKYSGSGSNIFNDAAKSSIYVSGPSGVHVNVTDEVLNNEIKDGSLYGLEVQNGKVVMKLISKNDN